MEVDPTRMCELLVGLPDVNVLGVVDIVDGLLEVLIEQRVERPECPSCRGLAVAKDRDEVLLADLPCFGRRARLRWRKHRWQCRRAGCAVSSWTGEDPRIAAPRMALTDRAGRWATVQVGRHGRAVSEVAADLGCDWHTVNDAVVAYGTVLIADPHRFGDCHGCRVGRDACGAPWPLSAPGVVDPDRRRRGWAAVGCPRRQGRQHLLCLVRRQRPQVWRDRVRWATLDLSSSYRVGVRHDAPRRSAGR